METVCFPWDRNSVCIMQMHFRAAVDAGPNRGRSVSIRGRSLSSWYWVIWRVFPSMLDSLTVLFHQCSVFHRNTAVIRRTSGRRMGSFKQSNPLLHSFTSMQWTNKSTPVMLYMLWHILLIMYIFGSLLPPSSGRVGNLFIFCQYPSRARWWWAYRRHVADQ